MLKRIVPLVALIALGGGIGAYALQAPAEDRPDCPGKVACPLTGELVCKDRCPLAADAKTTADEASALPACCRRRN